MRVVIDKKLVFSVLFVMWCGFFVTKSDAVHTLIPGRELRGNETLASAGKVFELGFFSTGINSNSYLGIWFKNDKNKKAVWVANGESPVLDQIGVLKIRSDGNLVIVDRRENPFIVNYGILATRSSSSNNTSATLLDSGNLILKDGDRIVWQSFDYPTDTLLPGMKIGAFNMNTDRMRVHSLTSWQSLIEPTPGDFGIGLGDPDPRKMAFWRKDGFHQDIWFWDGKNMRFHFDSLADNYNFTFVSNENEVYLTFSTKGRYNASWFVLTSSGRIDEFTLSEGKISKANPSSCEGTSTVNSTGCLIPMPSTCKGGDTFSDIKGLMLKSMIVSGSVRIGLSDCETICRSNCSCTAFASFHGDGTRCQLYYGEKSDLPEIIEMGDGVIYIRGAPPQESDDRRKKRLLLAVMVPVVSTIAIIVLSLLCYRQWRKFSFGRKGGNQDGNELPLFSFSIIAIATDNFSDENKIGEGGFGPVYKGRLPIGQEIAVKRLSKRSGQGVEEFKNEVTLISKLQHRNLVKLLGCCIKGEEKILIYEYMSNKSLDYFLFDSNKRELLDWSKRFYIIGGIAQGLLYLHKYSRLRIIHRDLKSSNILLDSHMNPKISDFGMARIFGENETLARTRRVVGTYGYMSPEYAVHGFFSVKSDVFSFGVIMLEIMSGKKNNTFYQSDHSRNLLEYAWDLWKDGRYLEFMDPILSNSFPTSEVMQCGQVGLLCVQDSAADRPTMEDVVSMLTNEKTILPPPKQPAFSTHVRIIEADLPTRRQKSFSLNEITESDIEGR